MEEEGDQLSESELLAMVRLLIIAGHETTSTLIGSGTLALLDHPEQLAALTADPGLIPGAVEELLRFTGPVVTPVPRFVTEDIELSGQSLTRGDAVIVALTSANHDESTFTNAEDLEIVRHITRHMAFG
jgi:cytochrome P450